MVNLIYQDLKLYCNFILKTRNVTNLNYLPFLTGTRACIGNKLALTEFKVLLSTLIRNFVFQQIEGFHIKKALFLCVSPIHTLG